MYNRQLQTWCTTAHRYSSISLPIEKRHHICLETKHIFSYTWLQ